MPRPLRLLLLALGLAFCGPARIQPTAIEPPPIDEPLPAEQRQRLLKALHPGLRPEEARKLLGAPDHVCRQVLAQRHLEQWVYLSPHFLRLEFHCPRGEKPQLQTVRPIAQPQP